MIFGYNSNEFNQAKDDENARFVISSPRLRLTLALQRGTSRIPVGVHYFHKHSGSIASPQMGSISYGLGAPVERLEPDITIHPGLKVTENRSDTIIWFGGITDFCRFDHRAGYNCLWFHCTKEKSEISHPGLGTGRYIHRHRKVRSRQSLRKRLQH